MKTAKSLVILALAFSAAHPLSADTLAVAQYAKSMNVVFAGVQPGVALTNFPALVRLSTATPGFSYSDFARPNGGDLRFADANGNLLPHEIDTWNSNGVSTVWVKVPLLEKGATITAHYGFTGTGNPAPVNSKDVWDDDYVGVWHLGESALPLIESSETSSNFTDKQGDTVNYAAPGVVGGSVDFGGGVRNAVVAQDNDALDGFSKFTIETWTYQDELSAGAGILSKRAGSKSEVSYHVDNQTGSGEAKRTVLWVGTSPSAAGAWSSTLTPTFGEWNHYAYTVDMTSAARNVSGYLNGTCSGATDYNYANTMPNCASDLYLGNLDAAATPSFKGRIDEVRISKTVRSADWIRATHDTIADLGFAVCVFGEVDYGENIENMLLKAATDKPNPIDYEENEPIKFNFRIDGITNTLPLAVRAKEPLCVIWERTADDGVSVKGTNTISLAGGCSVTTSLAVPGIIRMDAYLAGSDYRAITKSDGSKIAFGGGAGVATEEMQMSTVEPADFDTFWTRAKARLAAVPFNDSNVELVDCTPSNLQKTHYVYAAKIPCLGMSNLTSSVTGWLVVPKNAAAQSLKARVYFDGYSATIRTPAPPTWGYPDSIDFRVNAHGYDLVGTNSSYYLNFQNTINHTGENPPRETYALEASDYEDPEDTYLYYMALRAVRAFDYLKTRTEWDGKNLIAIGGSQGGLQTMWAGGLVEGISEIQPYITWGCDIGDPFIDKDHPWPTQSPLLSRTWGIPKTPNAYYFDAALHAKRVPTNCVATITRIGLGDKPCPMRGVLLSYYNMPCTVKEATLVQGADHLDESIPPQPNQVYTISSVETPVEEPEQPVEYGPLAVSQYAKSMNVVFDGVQSGVVLTNFPVLVKLSASTISGFSYADFARQDGGDLRFADANGNLLPHEIDTWNSNGVSTVWVKVPILEKDAEITAHYGFTGTGNPAPVNSKDVWDDDYVGVWHLGESALPLKESSKTSSNFESAHGSSLHYAAEGIVGGSVDFDGGAGNSVIAPDHDALDGFYKFTIEAWTLEDKFVSGAGILGKRGASRSSNAAYFIYDMGTDQAPKYALFMETNATTSVFWTCNLAPTFGEWNYLAYTVDMTISSSNARGYKNGAYTSANNVECASTMPNCASDLVLGNVSANNLQFPFGGKIDEVRISKVVRSAEWIKATHDTIKDAGFSVCVLGEVGPGGNIEDLRLKAVTDKENPINYVENETIRFNFSLDGVEALPLALQNQQLYVIWERTADDNVRVVGTNAITFAGGCFVETSLAVPGIVRMNAYLAGSDYEAIEKSGGKKIAFGGSAGVATEKMQLSTPEPADFDAFWAEAKAKLATVPFPTDGSELTEVFPASSNTNYYRFYAAKIPCYGPRPVTGWLVMPRNAQPWTLPIQAQFDGYGCIASRPSLPTIGQGQRVSFLVNAHGYEMVDHDDQYYRDFYNSTKGYALSAEDYANPTNAYLYYMAMRVMRAYEYLKSRPEWNGEDVEALGGSQGGLQAMWAGGLVEGITQLNPQITWGCDIANPDYLGSYPSPYTPRIPNVSGAYYFDAVLHARRVPTNCVANIMRIGMGDQTCPVRGVLLSYYNVKCKASATLVQGSDHDKATIPNPAFQEYTISKEASTGEAEDPTPSGEYGPLATNLYAKSMNVVFLGVQEGVTLADFPALVRLSAEIDGFDYADFALPNGGDLRFADADGTLLPHEIDTWNSNGVSTVWVKVPQLVKGTVITAHYGFTGSGELAEVDAKDVWDEGYVGVWHLGESSLPLMESSGVSTNITQASYSSPDDLAYAAPGVVGGSVDFKDGARNSISAPDHDALDGFSKFTIEVWTFLGESQFKPNSGILGKRGTRSSDEASYFIYNYKGSLGDPRCALYTGTTSAGNVSPCYLTPTFGKWNHLAYSVDMTTASSNVKGYADGECARTVSFEYGSCMPNCTNDLVIGNLVAGSPDGSFKGAIDEVRISKVVRSAEWIKATHDTIANSGFAFCTFDDVEGVYVVEIPVAGRINITREAAAELGVETIGKTSAEIAAALAANGANGIPLWQSYVLGLDPEDATSLPQVSIAMIDGIVELKLVGVDVNAMSGATVTYTVYKFADLADKASAQPVGGEHAAYEPTDVQMDASDDRMFYRVVVDVMGY